MWPGVDYGEAQVLPWGIDSTKVLSYYVTWLVSHTGTFLSCPKDCILTELGRLRSVWEFSFSRVSYRSPSNFVGGVCQGFFFFSNFCRSYNTLFYPPVWQSFIWTWFCWLKLKHQAKPLIFTYCCSRLMIIMIFTVHSQQTCKSCTICAKRRNVIWLCLPCICRVF